MAKKVEKEEKIDEPKHTEARVYSHNGGHIRTYTLEAHGEEFHDLAKQMAAQHHGSRIEVL
jgi:hypothetical protein